MAVPREQSIWNQLYARGAAGEHRPPAEVDSVPIPEAWGTLAVAEWQANEFCTTHLASARRVLDLGCGTGSIAAAWLKHFPELTIVGIDVSEFAISLGQQWIVRRPELSGRLKLSVGDLRHLELSDQPPFDMVMALFCMQFLSQDEFLSCLSNLRRYISPHCHFAGTVRSTARSIPASYEPIADQPYTYYSHEPHEAGMVYHHYTPDQLREGASALGGELIYCHEKQSYRDYDPAPVRAWWDFVIKCAP